MFAIIALIACNQNTPIQDSDAADNIAATSATGCMDTEYGALCDVPQEADDGMPYTVDCLFDASRISCSDDEAMAQESGCSDLEFGVYCDIDLDDLRSTMPLGASGGSEGRPLPYAYDRDAFGAASDRRAPKDRQPPAVAPSTGPRSRCLITNRPAACSHLVEAPSTTTANPWMDWGREGMQRDLQVKPSETCFDTKVGRVCMR